MLRKLCAVLIISIMMVTFAVQSFAAGPEIIYGSGTTSQFLVQILRPEGDETTFKKYYVVSGRALSDEAITVQLYKDGEVMNWDIGVSGFFMKEIALNDGPNKIRLAAYKKNEADSLETGVNLQVSDFTITVMNESFKDKIKDGITKISDFLKKSLEGK